MTSAYCNKQNSILNYLKNKIKDENTVFFTKITNIIKENNHLTSDFF